MPRKHTSSRRVIAVAGNIGSGKSSLVEFLRSRYEIEPFFEPNESNPYLEDFYADMKRWAFHSQLHFLTSKFRIHQALDRTPGVSVLDRTVFYPTGGGQPGDAGILEWPGGTTRIALAVKGDAPDEVPRAADLAAATEIILGDGE